MSGALVKKSLSIDSHVEKHAFLTRRILSACVASIVVLVLFAFVVFISQNTSMIQDTTTVRAISIAQAPPPPPPPPKEEAIEQETMISSVDIVLNTQGAALEFSATPVLKNISKKKVQSPEFDLGSIEWNKTLAVDFPEVDMDNLDNKPRLIASKKLRIARALRIQGINRVLVKVRILIDEGGRVYIKKIIDLVYPEMEPVVRKYIKHALFSRPTKNGQPVHADYIWKITFIEQQPMGQ
ncbi:MAG: hypothetical protein COA42_13100 [Alteromonadaceae bacterium]|nr:MAG: hypothetical protein COA42_13100 [Alteromonadaceae bacterium]